jgi:hypothetical protein
MSNQKPRDDGVTEFDWQSPRWREADQTQGDAELEHRLHDDPPPPARGAIDRGNSVGRRKGRKAKRGGPKS